MIKKGSDVKLNVRPVYIGLVHEAYYEGPCRFGKGDALQPEYDKMIAPEQFKEFCENVKNHMPVEVELLDPIYVECTDDWYRKEEMFETMAKDLDQVDFYLFSTFMGRQDVVVEFAQRYKKPLTLIPGTCCETVIINAAITSRGLECYAFRTWKDLLKQLRVLRVRKVLKNTNMLLCPRFNSTVSYSSVDTFLSLDYVTNKLGVKFRYINLHELLDQMTPAVEGGNPTTPGRKTPDLTGEDLAEANRLADEMIANANEVHVKREFLVNSLIAYITVKKNLDLRDCSAFTVPCPDACSTRRLNQLQFTFCLTHSLLNEEGIPSACEYDVNGLISLTSLINISGKASYLANCQALPCEDGTLDKETLANAFFLKKEDLDLIEDKTNLYCCEHSVPNRKLKGIQGEESQYALRHFAYDQGFGAVLRYDFKQDVGQTITLMRFSPDLTRMFVGKGTIVGGGGYNENNCNTYVVFRVEDQDRFYEGQKQVGNHIPLVYGDYVEELELLGKSLGLEVIKG